MEKPFQPKAVLISCIMAKQLNMLRQMVIFFLLFLFLFNAKAMPQKKWDGEGGDSLWSNPINWFPDGIPSANDDVLINNDMVLMPYTVLLPNGTTPTTVRSIKIVATPNQEIRVVIPSTNTASPAIAFNSTDTSLTIGAGATLSNASGAVAGNSIDLAGLFKIENGGKYIHQTARGNALLISKLVLSTSSHYGIFEFDVPGNNAYTISASGRQFGSLVFNGRGTNRKTYSCSGSGKMIIHGDLTINETAGLSSSLTNNIVIKRNLLVKGRLYINPVSADTSGRCLVMEGDEQLIDVAGQFNQGIHFRSWIINNKKTQLNSNVNMEQTESIFYVSPTCSLDFSTYAISGRGKFYADSGANLKLAGPIAVSSDSTPGSINTSSSQFLPAIHFVFYGTNEQATGNKFPTSIGSLTINKQSGMLNINNHLTILDSLHLINGKITVPDSTHFRLEGFSTIGTETSFVDGGIIRSANSKEIYFPTGSGNTFAPVEITRTDTLRITYKMEFVQRNTHDTINAIAYPLAQVDDSRYWQFTRAGVDEPQNTDEQLTLFRTNNMLTSTTVFNCIAHKQTTSSNWKIASVIPFDTIQQKITTNLAYLTSGKYAMGIALPVVLPLEKIYLHQNSNKNNNELKWTVNDDSNAEEYFIETSKDGIFFKTAITVLSKKSHGKTTYKRNLPTHFFEISYVRIRGLDKNGNNHLSNIIYRKRTSTEIKIYPNPSKDYLYMELTSTPVQINIVELSGRIIKPNIEKRGNVSRISIAGLASGKYLLVIQLLGSTERIPFIKL